VEKNAIPIDNLAGKKVRLLREKLEKNCRRENQKKIPAPQV